MAIFDKSGIDWNKEICPECGSEMKYIKHKGKSIHYFDPNKGWMTKRYLDKWVCHCGYIQTVENRRDRLIRLGEI